MEATFGQLEKQEENGENQLLKLVKIIKEGARKIIGESKKLGKQGKGFTQPWNSYKLEFL